MAFVFGCDDESLYQMKVIRIYFFKRHGLKRVHPLLEKTDTTPWRPVLPSPPMNPPAPLIRDISPPLNASTPTFPGDTAYSQTWVATLAPGCPVNVSAITLSPHLGAHADAPLHYDAAGAAVGALDLLPFIGPCRVIHAIAPGPLVLPQHLAHALPAATAAPLPPRVLIRVYQRMPQDHFDPDLPGLAPDTVELLARLGVVLVGTDSASIDPASSKTLDSHQAIRRHGMRVLENLLLDEVPEGDYELIALPLKLTYADASPVRAVLRPLQPSPAQPSR
jgi:arylformamidase